MPKIDAHVPGSFCWVELATTGQNEAKSFYSSLFGWTIVDFPMGPEEVYTTFTLNGGNAAAAYTMREPEKSMAPPHWNLYIAVESADAAAARAGELGGTVLVAPFDVMTLGRMAVIQDPSGAVFCVWQKYEHIGISVAGENGTLCFADLITGGLERAKTFYEGLFGWKIGNKEGYPPDYKVIENAGRDIAGIPTVTDPNMPPHWSPVFLVPDVDAAVKSVTAMGGKTYFGPVTKGKVSFAVLADGQGAAFTVLKM